MDATSKAQNNGLAQKKRKTRKKAYPRKTTREKYARKRVEINAQ